MAPRAALSASRCAALIVAACVVTVFVFETSNEDTAINREAVSTSANAECDEIHSELARQHDRFWQQARSQVVTQFGQGVSDQIQSDFTSEISKIQKQMTEHGCPGTDVACEALEKARRGTVEAVQHQVSNLLTANPEFKASRHSMDVTTQDLETRLLSLKCGASLAQEAATAAAAATSTADAQSKGVEKEAVEEAAKAAESKAEEANREHHEQLEGTVKRDEADIEKEKDDIAREERHMAHMLAEEKDALERHKDTITARREEIAKTKKKMALSTWAKNQRDALLHAKAIPPPAAAEYKGDTPQPTTQMALDAHLSHLFEDEFEESDETVPVTGLVQIEEEAPAATVSKKIADLAGLKDQLKATDKSNHESVRLKHTDQAVISRMAEGHPVEKTAVASADAVEAVNEQVRFAAHEAAEKAAHKAADTGLGAKDTLAMVRAAARTAAKKAARSSHQVFEEALSKQPTPAMLAKEYIIAGTKEAAIKHRAAAAVEASKKKLDVRTTAQMQKKSLKDKGLEAAVRKSVTGHHSIAQTKKLIAEAEGKAVAAEAKAWNSDVDDADSKDDILKAIHAYQKANPSMTLPQATQKWEENEVVKLKDRFARHFTTGLNVNPTTKEGQLASLHEVDRQKINVEKMVLENAEVQAVIAKRNAEKSAKSALRIQESAKRYRLAAANTLSQKVKEIHTADNQADEMQRQAVTRVLAKDASETLKAKTEANAAKAKSKHAEAAKAQALSALDVARSKLTSLSKAAAAGTAMLGAKLKMELKARQEQVSAKIAQVKADTAHEVEARIRKEVTAEYEKKVEAEKEKGKLAADQANKVAEGHASKVVHEAQSAAASAKALAEKEKDAAERSEARSKEIADEATTRAKVIKSAAAEQMQELATQKADALKHFKEFSDKLKKLENEKSAKAEARTAKAQRRADAATQEAAKAARFADEQMAEADLQASHAMINKAKAAGAILRSTIERVRTVDTRSRGHVAIAGEKLALVNERKDKVRAKQMAAEEVAERKTKLAMQTKEVETKADDRVKEVAKKQVIKEAKAKHDKIEQTGYEKGIKHAQALFDAKQNKANKKKAAMLNAKKVAAVETKAKALLKVARKVKAREETPEQSQARKLVREAVATTAVNHDAGAAVDHASQELKAFLKSNAGVAAEKKSHKDLIGPKELHPTVKAAAKAVAQAVKTFGAVAVDEDDSE